MGLALVGCSLWLAVPVILVRSSVTRFVYKVALVASLTLTRFVSIRSYIDVSSFDRLVCTGGFPLLTRLYWQVSSAYLLILGGSSSEHIGFDSHHDGTGCGAAGAVGWPGGAAAVLPPLHPAAE